MKNLDLIKEYVDAAGPSGFEREAFKVMEKHVSNSCDELTKDNLGSLIAIKKSSEDAPKVMIAGHLDEIGFMVTKIDKDGYVYFTTLGGWWGQVMLAQRMDIVDKTGKRHTAVIGSKPPHSLSPEERVKPVDIKNMYLDLGVKNREDVEKLGIEVGDFIVPYCEFMTMGDEKFLLGKAFDNRIGCYIAAEVMVRLKNEKLNVNLYSVGTVQEEVGTRGAATASNKINPDIGFALDVGLANDIPGKDENGFPGKLGDGPLITLFDAGLIAHQGLKEFVVNVAKDSNISYQYAGLSGGGTDGGPMHTSHDGCPTLYVGLATRYIHSNTGIIHYDDVENAINLIVEVVKKLDKESVEKIRLN